MQGESTQSRVVGIRQLIDDRVHTVTPDNIVVLLGGFNKVRVAGRRQQRVGQVPEKLLQQSGNTIDIMVEVFWVTEVEAL